MTAVQAPRGGRGDGETTVSLQHGWHGTRDAPAGRGVDEASVDGDGGQAGPVGGVYVKSTVLESDPVDRVGTGCSGRWSTLVVDKDEEQPGRVVVMMIWLLDAMDGDDTAR